MPSSFPDFGWEEGEGGGRKVATGKQSIFLSYSTLVFIEAFFERDIKRLFFRESRLTQNAFSFRTFAVLAGVWKFKDYHSQSGFCISVRKFAC